MRRLVVLLVLSLAASASAGINGPAYKGMSYTSFGAEALAGIGSDESLFHMSLVGTDTVALNVWWFQDNVSSNSMAQDLNYYSSSMSSIEHAIDEIHSRGMKVMLKPMLDSKDGQWRAYINPTNPNLWFSNYTSFIGTFADMARNKGVEMLSIGCEMNNMENPVHNARWTNLINELRDNDGLHDFNGPLTYAANWSAADGVGGGYQSVPWWNQLDYIGIDAYFPVTGHNPAAPPAVDPTPAQLQAGWTTLANTIETWRSNAGLTSKPVLFTEVGYGSYNGSNRTPWAGPEGRPVDQQEQADTYAALLGVMSQRSWFDGAFWWSWETRPHAGVTDTGGFTPQDKLVQQVLANYYGGVLPPPAPPPRSLVASWETGTENFGVPGFAFPATAIAVSAIGPTHGDQTLAVTTPDNGFNWSVMQNVGGDLLQTFHEAAADKPNHVLEFDVTYRDASLPTGSISLSVALNSDDTQGLGGWSQVDGLASASTSIDQTKHVSIPLTQFDLAPGSTWYQMALAISGNWGNDLPGTIYLDNLRIRDLLSVEGDFDRDGDIDATDIDLMYLSFGFPSYDLTGDMTTDQADVDYLIGEILGTTYGDADLDGDVDGADFDTWRIRDSLGGGIGWGTGDFDGDGDVDGADFDLWRLRPEALGGSDSVSAVPEPGAAVLLLIALPWVRIAQRKTAKKAGGTDSRRL